MRTNIFCTSEYLNVDASIKDSIASMEGTLGIVKADSNGRILNNFLNLIMRVGGGPNIEISRVIPISLCDLNIKEGSFTIVDKYSDETTLFYSFDVDGLVNEEIGFRLTIPAGFNHRHSWTFSYKIKQGDTTEAVNEKFNNMILNSSIKEHVGVYVKGQDIVFVLNEEHNAVLVQPLYAMPSDGIFIEKDSFDLDDTSLFSTLTAARNYLIKLAVDADANYGFDYVDNAFHELYPNQLSYKDIEKYIMSEIVTNHGPVDYKVFHITFTEPRNVETTGDVVKQVINIICNRETHVSDLIDALALASGLATDDNDSGSDSNQGNSQSSGGKT